MGHGGRGGKGYLALEPSEKTSSGCKKNDYYNQHCKYVPSMLRKDRTLYGWKLSFNLTLYLTKIQGCIKFTFPHPGGGIISSWWGRKSSEEEGTEKGKGKGGMGREDSISFPKGRGRLDFLP